MVLKYKFSNPLFSKKDDKGNYVPINEDELNEIILEDTEFDGLDDYKITFLEKFRFNIKFKYGCFKIRMRKHLERFKKPKLKTLDDIDLNPFDINPKLN